MRKLKVGDRVLVKSREWYDAESKDKRGYVHFPEESFVTDMVKYLGTIVTISYISDDGSYRIEEDEGDWGWIDDMFDPSYYFSWEMKNFPDYIECKNILSSKMYEGLKYSKVPGELLNIRSLGFDSSIVKKFEKLYICKEAYLMLANSLFPNWRRRKKYSLVITISTVSARIKFMTIEFPTNNMRGIFMTKFHHLIDDFKINAEKDGDFSKQLLNSGQYEEI